MRAAMACSTGSRDSAAVKSAANNPIAPFVNRLISEREPTGFGPGVSALHLIAWALHVQLREARATDETQPEWRLHFLRRPALRVPLSQDTAMRGRLIDHWARAIVNVVRGHAAGEDLQELRLTAYPTQPLPSLTKLRKVQVGEQIRPLAGQLVFLNDLEIYGRLSNVVIGDGVFGARESLRAIGAALPTQSVATLAQALGYLPAQDAGLAASGGWLMEELSGRLKAWLELGLVVSVARNRSGYIDDLDRDVVMVRASSLVNAAYLALADARDSGVALGSDAEGLTMHSEIVRVMLAGVMSTLAVRLGPGA